MLLQMSLIMLAEKRASHFRVSYDIFMSIMGAAKPVFSVCTHDGGCAYWAAEPKYTYVVSAIPQSIRNLVELLSLLARQQKWYYRLQQAQSLIPYNYIPYTGTLVGVHQSVLVEYCTFIDATHAKEKGLRALMMM